MRRTKFPIRSLFPTDAAVTVQIAGRHLYLVFDNKLASQIYRRSKVFIFDPFNLMVFATVGGSKEDLKVLEMGAQTVKKNPQIIDDGRRVLYGLHSLLTPHLTGDSLNTLTNLFIQTLCDDIDKKFPPNKDSSYEWQTLNLCDFVKDSWTHASITGLYGSHIYSIWPDVETWLWDFDQHFQKIIAKIPRLMAPKAYALRDKGKAMFVLWEQEALKAEAEGKIVKDADWDPYWGLRFSRVRVKHLTKNEISPGGRAGNGIAFMWGVSSPHGALRQKLPMQSFLTHPQLTANAIPIAMQVMNQAVLNPSLLSDLRAEISKSQTGPTSFDMRKVTNQPKLKSVYLEALRWATASPSPRVVREDCELGEYKLKANSMVIVPSRSLQMDKATWEIPDHPESDPTQFWPERFLDGDEGNEADRLDENAEAEENYLADTISDHAKTPKKANTEPISGPKSKEIQQRMLALRPFGGGTTLCPGRHFATNEILGGLAALMLRLEVEVIEDELKKNGAPQPNLMKQGGLFPDRPLMVRMRRWR